MRPDYQIIADESDITAKIRERFLSLSLTDNRGMQSDSLKLVLDDRDNLLAIPRKGTKLRLKIGWQGKALVDRGSYTVDTVDLSGPPDQMTIKANAADLREGMKAPKDRSWDQVTVGDLVGTIASDHGLKAKVAESLSSIALVHVDQTSESDLHLLTRLGGKHGAIAKPVNDFLLFVPRGEAKSVSGKLLKAVTINRNQTSRHSMSSGDRAKYQSVTAKWQDTASGTEQTETFGSGEPVYQLRTSHASAAEAKTAAEAKYRDLQYKGARLMLSLSVCDPGLFAEAPIIAEGFRSGIDGDWVADSVAIDLNDRGLTGRVVGVMGR